MCAINSKYYWNLKYKGDYMEINDREKGLIKECLVMVAKSPNVAVEQMKELIVLSEKFVVIEAKTVKK
jgi:hypothetical protein